MPAVDDYLARLAERERREFERIRRIGRETVPDVEEGTSYGLPAFKYKQRPLLGFTTSTKHLSVFPFGASAVDAVRDELRGFDLSKGTIRFTASTPLPDSAVEHLLHARMAEIGEVVG